MRVLHTSDWHLGRPLFSQKRYEEFSAFLDWLARTLQEKEVDVLVVPGDIFDSGTPSNRAQRLYYDFLRQVYLSPCRHVVITAGNHDSPSMLGASREILQVLDIHVVGNLPEDPADEVKVLRDAQGKVALIVCAVPFLRDADMRLVEEGESSGDKESKMQEGQLDLDLPGYHQYWNYAVKKGYSGTGIFTKEEPISVSYGLGIEEHDQEGRVITLEFKDYYFITVYTPNSQSELARLSYRMKWEEDFLAYLKKLEEKKPVIFCGDLNVAVEEIDLKNPKTNRKNAGFTDEERKKMRTILSNGFIDTFRYLYPDQTGIYSWWSYRFNARKNNAGWRIDYFVVSECLKDRISDAKILTDVMGSDHCPIELDFE